MKLFILFIVFIIIVSAALSFINVPTEIKRNEMIETTKMRLAKLHDNQNQIAAMLLSISDRLDNMKKTEMDTK